MKEELIENITCDNDLVKFDRAEIFSYICDLKEENNKVWESNIILNESIYKLNKESTNRFHKITHLEIKNSTLQQENEELKSKIKEVKEEIKNIIVEISGQTYKGSSDVYDYGIQILKPILFMLDKEGDKE